VRLLPDTHVWLWMLLRPELVSTRAADLFRREDVERLFSAASAWEAAIKRALGKLDPPADFTAEVLGGGAAELPISARHGEAAGALPAHHRDPFDRLLVAQARLEGAVLISSDTWLKAYDVEVIW
jgi:PIN domain nuclease of toxin-antitoxin system